MFLFSDLGPLNFTVFKGNGYTLKGDKPVKIVFVPSEKGSTLNGKNLLPLVDPHSEGGWCTEKQTGNYKRILHYLNWRKSSTHVYVFTF